LKRLHRLRTGARVRGPNAESAVTIQTIEPARPSHDAFLRGPAHSWGSRRRRLLCAAAPRRSSMTTSPVGIAERAPASLFGSVELGHCLDQASAARISHSHHVSAHTESRNKSAPSPTYLAKKPPIRSRDRRSFVDPRSLPDSAVDPTKSQHITVSWRRSALPCRVGEAGAADSPPLGHQRAMSVPCRAMMIASNWVEQRVQGVLRRKNPPSLHGNFWPRL
jgi:hypothetical protein